MVRLLLTAVLLGRVIPLLWVISCFIFFMNGFNQRACAQTSSFSVQLPAPNEKNTPKKNIPTKQGAEKENKTLEGMLPFIFSPPLTPLSFFESPIKTVLNLPIPNLPLGVVNFPNGKAINLSVSMGRSAFHSPHDPAEQVWLMTDRGPTITCADAKRLISMEPEQICGEKNGLIYLLPGFVPSIYRIDIEKENSTKVSVFVPFKSKSGKPFSGRPPASLLSQGKHFLFSTDSKQLVADPLGIDPTAFVRLKDGSFLVAENFGPSLLELTADGTVTRRIIPPTQIQDFKDADYEVAPYLLDEFFPLNSRSAIEGMALSPDETFVYLMVRSAPHSGDVPEQNKIPEPNRMFVLKIARETGKMVDHFLYYLDRGAHPPARVSEIVMISENRLLVVERVEKNTRFVLATLPGSHPSSPADEEEPTSSYVAGKSIQNAPYMPISQLFETDMLPYSFGKLEGSAVLTPSELIVVSDNGFGIDGTRTMMFRWSLSAPLLK